MNKIIRLFSPINHALAWLAPLVDLGIRLYVANVFFTSGLVKIQSWQSTLTLFEYEYAVPLLPPELAAYLGTAAELTLPVLLVLGLGGRITALALFLFNMVAAISYPDLSDIGRQDHIYWGMLLGILTVHGLGKLSLDNLLSQRLGRSG